MKNSIYDHDDYKVFLGEAVDLRGKGARSELARAVGCQSGYVTHVLNGTAHFSLEQGQKIANFLGLDEVQTDYLLSLLSYGRAGSDTLRSYFHKKLEALRSQNQVLKSRLKAQKSLSIEDQTVFYSSWHYGAFHVAVSLPGCETENGLSEWFGLPLKRVNEIVQFLERTGLITREEGKLKIGSSQIFVGSDSPLISKFHTNWRMKAIESFDHYTEKELHYSSVITVSQSDVKRIREMMVKTIEEIRAVIRESKDETCFSYALDLFEVKRF